MLWAWLLVLVALSTRVYAQVRGVAPKDTHLYEPQNVSGYREPMFQCLRSGKLIPFKNVNDDTAIAKTAQMNPAHRHVLMVAFTVRTRVISLGTFEALA